MKWWEDMRDVNVKENEAARKRKRGREREMGERT